MLQGTFSYCCLHYIHRQTFDEELAAILTIYCEGNRQKTTQPSGHRITLTIILMSLRNDLAATATPAMSPPEMNVFFSNSKICNCLRHKRTASNRHNYCIDIFDLINYFYACCSLTGNNLRMIVSIDERHFLFFRQRHSKVFRFSDVLSLLTHYGYRTTNLNKIRTVLHE